MIHGEPDRQIGWDREECERGAKAECGRGVRGVAELCLQANLWLIRQSSRPGEDA